MAPSRILRLVMEDGLSLPHKFNRELNLPGCSRGGSKRAAAGHWRQILVEDQDAGRVRRRKVGMVQDIKELCPKLYIEGFGDALDAIILVQRHVQVQHTRPHSDITPSVAQPVHRVRNREASGGDVVILVARANGMIASGQRDPIRLVVLKTRYEQAERVAPNQ